MHSRSRLTNIIRVLGALLCFGLVALCLYFGAQELTPRENTLLGVMLAIFSLAASWILTHMYAEASYKKLIEDVKESHQSNLRVFALKAAEKVNNLSNELSRLTTYLQQSLEGEFETADVENLTLREKIESTIHLVHTLKSVNDTSLSDWKGVIGDEIQRQREAREEQEKEIQKLLERVAYLESATKEVAFSSDQELRHELRMVRNILVHKGGPTVVSSRPRRNKERVVLSCPNCDLDISYRQRASPSVPKAVKCNSCGSRYSSSWSTETGFVLSPRVLLIEVVNCPSCTEECEVELDSFVGSASQTTCADCTTQFRVVRTKGDELKIGLLPVAGRPVEPFTMTEAVISKVQALLPTQPWPTGTHSLIAAKLGLTKSQVSRVIAELVSRGIFKQQIDGKLYVPLSEADSNKNPA